VRLGAGAVAMMRPYTLWGPALGGGYCVPTAGMRVCGDVAADLFVGGTDLPDRGAVVQVLFGIGVVVDAR